MNRFTPTPAPADKSLFYAAIMVSLALHLLLLLLTGNIGLPRIPEWTPQALKVVLLQQAVTATPTQQPTQLAQHDSIAGSATPAPQSDAPAHIASPSPSTTPKPKPDDAKPVLTRDKAPQHIAQSTAQSDNTPQSAQDWLNQARSIGKENTSGGENQDKSKAVFGVNASGVNWARYVEDWRLKIERIGKLNYPAEARSQNLYGSLELAVVIRADGSLQEVRLLRSSGHTILDQAAQNIVRLAAPYPPFPPALAADFRSLEVVRKWSFTSANQLSAN